ncbi:Spy/CpxP family protein refolding chaperone [Xenorhabdus innexi]|uniref:Periplasmic protein n=1 Tax=Xenorhabdus innexi TaxID=290109 RepID=A0A1N6MRS2_9GAMM|nr:Spy/CpxP family protein refolding chaperone [Xenorhabdus innexi]PHM38554.1 periplasmic protein negative regulator of cpxR [Xenorhabdus innexi]SIP71552.1 Periplasmic protein [Xenorhabdus innexi]
MRKIAILALVSISVLGTVMVLAETADTYNASKPDSLQLCLPYDNSDSDYYQRNYNYSCVFGGITLTEEQRQQMWDLVKKQPLHEQPIADMQAEHQKMYSLLIAKNFDEAAIRAQLEKIAKYDVDAGVEVARIRNQMYQLLTPEQEKQLQRCYQARTTRCLN